MKHTRLFSILICLALIFSISNTAFAASNIIDLNCKGTISICLKDKGLQKTDKYGGSFLLFHVADAVSKDNTLSYKYVDSFISCGVDLGDFKSQTISKELANFAEKADIRADRIVSISGENIVISDLKLGVYLIVQNEDIPGYYPIEPFIVTLPTTNQQGDRWIYDVEAAPKLEVLPITTTTITAVKRWEGDTASIRPKSINIELWNANSLFSTVRLSPDNSWTYTWESLDASATWTIKETNVPENYSVTYSRADQIITITNKYTSPKKPPLIQTGQLNWPIPVLASIGLLFVFVGVLLQNMTNKNEEK